MQRCGQCACTVSGCAQTSAARARASRKAWMLEPLMNGHLRTPRRPPFRQGAAQGAGATRPAVAGTRAWMCAAAAAAHRDSRCGAGAARRPPLRTANLPIHSAGAIIAIMAAVRPNTTVPARSSRQMVGWSAGRRLKLKKTRPAPAWQPPGPAPYPTAVSVQAAAAVRFSSHLLRALVVTILGSHIPDKPQQANARNVAAECGAQPPQSAQCSPQG